VCGAVAAWWPCPDTDTCGCRICHPGRFTWTFVGVSLATRLVWVPKTPSGLPTWDSTFVCVHKFVGNQEP
jgi:hypothetical protein